MPKNIFRKATDNLSGKTFGRLTVLHCVGTDVSKKRRWLCRCECGQKTVVITNNLKSGSTKSCGCLRIEDLKQRRLKHGHSGNIKTKTYRAWLHMLDRCRNPNCNRYEYYGGRGIAVSSRWFKFTNFLEDMGNPPSKVHTIERIDNSKGYCLENCRWATKREQANNKRNNVNITFQGKTKTIAQWAKILGINYGTLRSRIVTRQWSTNRALTQEIGNQGGNYASCIIPMS